MSYGSIQAVPGVGASGSRSPVLAAAEGHGLATTAESRQDSGAEAGTNGCDQEDTTEPSPLTPRQRLHEFYQRNIGLFFVFIAQICASIMAITAKVLATGFETKFHALQIIFVRMGVTAILGFSWMWYKQVPESPWGRKSIRGLLVLRGIAGFTGLFGLYYSVTYLEVSDATVITFVVPSLTAFICFVTLGEPYSLKEALAGLIAFIGVLFVARPTFLFPRPDSDDSFPTLLSTKVPVTPLSGGIIAPLPVTPSQRALAVVAAVIGTFGAATAYSTIRTIGKRAHSLISVNYFAMFATLGSAFITLVHPELEFKMPSGAGQWGCLVIIGITGFLLQFCLTEGLQREKAGRAMNMIYVQMVFAIIGERVIWGTVPTKESWMGSALIIGSALWVSLQKQATEAPKETVPDEESRLLGRTEDA